MISDLLSSASLILAAITFLYTSWYPSIEEAINYSIDRQYADAKSDHKRLKSVLRNRALPISIASTLMMIIFLPDAIKILVVSISNLELLPFWASLKYYDANAAVLLFIDASFLSMIFFFWSLVGKLQTKYLKFERKRIEYEKSKSAV